ncbi:cytochrome P450 [Nonomuraea sp. NPDC050310]|uniref:cytochrome P450 n=1 Tax=unclassified Nonomuraea TaxID=2593643 RepID=UPI0033DFDA48
MSPSLPFPSDPAAFTPIAGQQPAGLAIPRLDLIREEHRAFRSEVGGGFWVLTRYEAIVAALQDHELFSNAAVSVFDPEPRYRWIPEMLDPPEHTEWRRRLRPLFAPGRIAAMETHIRATCAALVRELAGRGECDFVPDFARRFPTTIFLELMGLPVERLETFLAWEDAILHAPPAPDRREARMAAMGEVSACFAELIRERRAEPRDDLVSVAAGWDVPEEDLLALCLLLFLAGLDTVTAQLSFAFWHLSEHPAERAALVAEPARIPAAVEEFVRAYSIVLPGRKLTRDAVVEGCPMRAGEMVLLPLTMANRDPGAFPDAAEVVLDRAKNRHLGFGAGVHRCLGAHLARAELRIALEEWHRVIPDYQVSGEVVEHVYQLLGLDHLPLRWATG